MKNKRTGYLRSLTIWSGVLAAFASPIGILLDWCFGPDAQPFPGRLLLGVTVASVLGLFGVVVGRRRASGPLVVVQDAQPTGQSSRRTREKGGGPGVVAPLLLAGILGAFSAGCSGGLAGAGTVGQLAGGIVQQFPCADVEATVEYPTKPADLLALEDLVRVLVALHAGLSDQIERDLVAVVVTGCGRRAAVRLTVGLEVGAAPVVAPPAGNEIRL